MKNLKHITALLAATALLLFTACGDGNSKTESKKKQSKYQLKKNDNDKETTVLCKINGKPWHYNKVSTLIERDGEGKDEVQTIRVTFSQYPNNGKGKNWVILLIDRKTLELKSMSFDEYITNTEGKKTGVKYNVSNQRKSEAPDVKHNFKFQLNGEMLSGTGNATGAIGKLVLKYDNIDKKYLYAQLTDLKFENVRADDAMGKLKKTLGK